MALRRAHLFSTVDLEAEAPQHGRQIRSVRHGDVTELDDAILQQTLALFEATYLAIRAPLGVEIMGISFTGVYL